MQKMRGEEAHVLLSIIENTAPGSDSGSRYVCKDATEQSRRLTPITFLRYMLSQAQVLGVPWDSFRDFTHFDSDDFGRRLN